MATKYVLKVHKDVIFETTSKEEAKREALRLNKKLIAGKYSYRVRGPFAVKESSKKPTKK